MRACLRSDRRRSWRGWLRDAVLIGIVAGGLLALLAGADRTRESYGRFIPLTVLVAIAVAVPPAILAARTDPARVLHSE